MNHSDGDEVSAEQKTISICFNIKTFSTRKTLLGKIFPSYGVSPVQGEPFKWGVEVKNISDVPSPEFEIIEPFIVNLDNTYSECSDATIAVRSLNPSESIYVDLDKCTLFLEGVMWAKFLAQPKDENFAILAYQIDENHNKVAPCPYSKHDDTNWMKDIYVHKKSEVLQGRTNNLIIILTIITVLEAVFKIREFLKFLLWSISEIFGLISGFFSLLRSLI